MSEGLRGHGVGTLLVQRLIAVAEAEGIWTLQAQIIAANHASRTLHVKCGFREVGVRERLGQIRGVWHDVALLERRSTVNGGPGLPGRLCDTTPSRAPAGKR